MIYGYARVATDSQSVDAGGRQLNKAGCRKVFRETAIGAKTDRTDLHKVLANLNEDDVLVVTRLDRLARSTQDRLNILSTIADRKAGFRSLGGIWIDTTTAHAHLLLTVLGVKMGPPPKPTPHQVKEAQHRRDADEPMRDITRSYDVSHSTISTLAS
jgi:DNA invertase Pin-like site-specific DNA recombinase